MVGVRFKLIVMLLSLGINQQLRYQARASVPAKGTTTLLDYDTIGAFIQSGDLGGNTDFELVSNWPNRMDFANDIGGASKASPYRLFGNLQIIGNSANVGQGDKVLGLGRPGVNFWEIYDVIIQGNPSDAVTGIICFEMGPNAVGNYYKLQGCYLLDSYFAGFIGNIVRPGETIDEMHIIDTVIDGYTTSGESGYTNTTAKEFGTYNDHALVKVQNCALTNKGWDQIQFNSISEVYHKNNTHFNSGVANVGGQWFMQQNQNTRGASMCNILSKSVGSMIVAAHDYEFRNNFKHITKDEPIIIQNLLDQYPNATQANGKAQIWRELYVLYDPEEGEPANMTTLFDVSEEDADILIDNLVVSNNITQIVADNRDVAATNSLEIRNQSIADLTAPIFRSEDRLNPNYMSIASPWHHSRGLGKRSSLVGIAPYALRVNITGTFQPGNELACEYVYEANGGGDEGGTEYQWMRNGVAIPGKTTANYTIVTDDIDDTISCRVTPVGALLTGTPCESIRKTIIAAPNVFDNFDVRNDHVNDVVADGSNNVTAWNGMSIEGTPVLDAVNNSVHCSGEPDDDGFEYAKPALAAGFEVFWHLELQASGSTQWLESLAGNNGFRIDSNRQINAFNFNTGENIPLVGYNVIRIRIDGASSFVQVNNGAKTTFSVSPTVGTANGHLGKRSDGSNSANAKWKFRGISSNAISDADATEIYNQLTA